MNLVKKLEEKLPDDSMRTFALFILMGLFIGSACIIMIIAEALRLVTVAEGGYPILIIVSLWGFFSWFIVLQAWSNEKKDKEEKKE